MNKLLLAVLLPFSLITFAHAESSQNGGSTMSSILMLVAFFAIFYFLLIRPQMKRNKEQRKMIADLTKGDEVMINGGIIGKIVKIGDNYTEIDIANDVVIKVQKNSVSGVLPKGSIKTN